MLSSLVSPLTSCARMKFSDIDMRPLLATLFILLSPTLVSGFDKDAECINGIRTAVSEFTFFTPDASGYWPNFCNNTYGVRSLWASVKLYCSPEEIVAGTGLIGPYCLEYGMVELTPYETILPELTDEYMANLQVVNWADINETKIWNNSVVLSPQFYKEAWQTTVGQ